MRTPPTRLIESALTYLHRYEILSSPETKEVYDRHGMEGLSGPGGPGGGMDPADIFADLFGGGGGMNFGFDFGGMGGGGPQRRKKGQDSVIPYEVTLEDLYIGKSIKMNLEKDLLCNTCSGYVSICLQ